MQKGRLLVSQSAQHARARGLMVNMQGSARTPVCSVHHLGAARCTTLCRISAAEPLRQHDDWLHMLHRPCLQVARRRAWRWHAPPTAAPSCSCWTTL